MTEHKKVEQGYTMVEVLIVVGIVAILAAAAAPNFSSAVKSSRMTGHFNALSSSLSLARSEAIKRASHVSVCAMDTETNCGTDWAKGWLVFNDDGVTQGAIDAGEEIIKRITPDDPTLLLTNSARLNPSSASPVERPFIRFGPRGASNWRGSGYFIFCDDRGTDAAKVANVTLSGDVRRGRKDANDQIVNSFGDPAACS